MARLVLCVLAVLPLIALADQWGFLFCGGFTHDGSAPNNQLLYGGEIAFNQPLSLYAASEPDSGKNISCVKMNLDLFKGVSVNYNFNDVPQTAVTSDSYNALDIRNYYKFTTASNHLFGSSDGGSINLAYTGKYNETYYVYKNCFQGFLMHWIRTYVFVSKNFNATANNFTEFQAGFKAKYGVPLNQKAIC